MATNDTFGTLVNTNGALVMPFFIEIWRQRETSTWVITAVLYRPSENELKSYDDVHRFFLKNRMYYVAIRGGTLSRDAARGLCESHESGGKEWVNFDLRKFD